MSEKIKDILLSHRGKRYHSTKTEINVLLE